MPHNPQVSDSPESNESVKKLPLQRWLWGSYLRAALIPLLVIELSFLGIYWVTNLITYRDTVETVRQVSSDYLGDVSQREALAISNELRGVSEQTQLFANQALRALNGNYDPPASEKQRHGRRPDGAFISLYDNGTTASFYSGIMPIGPEEIRKVWRLSVLDPLMIDIKETSHLISSLYFNTFDSYNRIYPYFRVTDQYPAKMNIPAYNFYYEADAKHNPERKPVWTEAYVDPAGHGWMVSSVAPVWRGNKLEGVVGIDVTLEAIIKRLNTLRLPWGSYAMLVDRSGRIIAMPPAGERDLGLQELTRHRYETGITADTFKPDEFDLGKRPETRQLARALVEKESGQVSLDLKGGARTASFSTVAGPHWHLIIIAPTANIYAEAEAVRTRSQLIGAVMVIGLLLFYAVFFMFLYRRARAMSQEVAEPVEQIAALVERIGGGAYDQDYDGSRVREIDQLGRELVQTGAKLGQAHRKILAQEQVVSHALEHQQRLNEEQIRFARVTSHELRTPLAIIDSTAQIIDRKAEALAPSDLKSRAARLRSAVGRMAELIDKLSGSVQAKNAAACDAPEADAPAELETILAGVAEKYLQAGSALLVGDVPPATIANGGAVTRVLASVLENAVRYGGEAGPVRIEAEIEQDLAGITVSDSGPGISEEERRRIGEPYYRGAASFGTHGAGLGLHVARREIESIGGTLTISSDKDGTKVHIAVPVAPLS